MTTNADLSLVVNSTRPSSLPQSAGEMAPPIKPKAQTITTSSQDAHLLVRETIRISATLASEPPSASAHSSSSISAIPVPVECRSIDYGRLNEQFVDSSFRLICCEEYDGRRWKYVVDENGGSGKIKKSSIRAVSLQTPPTPVDELIAFIRSYVVPEGFPESVTPSYVPYMSWRALKHFFGGAISKFTTQTLLSSVGVSRNKAAPGAVAINWILKDGAGRVGKMLFARQGKKFDYDLKQLRFAGDLLMELGAGVELATAAMPHLFLPLACAANVAKNVAAVTSTSTRTPIYKAFARGENIGTSLLKEKVLATLQTCQFFTIMQLGTGLSIMVSKGNPSLLCTFAFLSCGYVFSSYQEVWSLVLHTLNRARFSVAVESFLKTGQVPSLKEGNMKEKIFSFPWLQDRPVIIGSRFEDAFQDQLHILHWGLSSREKYMVTYNPEKDKVYALLRDEANSDDILKAAFHGHVLLHGIHLAMRNQYHPRKHYENDISNPVALPVDIEARVAESCKTVSTTYGVFKSKAAEQGWVMSESLLNPGRARIYR